VGLIFGHVECECVLHDEFEICFDELVGVAVVAALDHFLPHLIDAHGCGYDFVVASDLFKLWVVKVLVFVEYFELFDDPLEYLSALLEAAVGTDVGGLVQHLLLLLPHEVAVAKNVDPFIAVLFITLHPLPVHLLHADHTVLIIFVVLETLNTENTLIFHKVLLVLQLIRTHLALQTVVASVFGPYRGALADSLQLTADLVE
jgi:hypothetical protein